MAKKSDMIYMARIAEKAERYNEMKEYMRTVASTPDPVTNKVDLSSDERNLLSIAYKNVVNNKRVSWRILNQYIQKESKKENSPYIDDITEFLKNVEKELIDVCNEILNLLNDFLIPGATDGSQKVFYWKLKGDYYRYVCEFEKDEEQDKMKVNAREAYFISFLFILLVIRRLWTLAMRRICSQRIQSCWVWLLTFLFSITRLRMIHKR